MVQGSYDIAQVCLNGHVINSSSVDYPSSNQAYCASCGSKTITQCPDCQAPIRGYYRGSMSITPMSAPSFCINCGQPYPWTASRLEAARQLTEEIENLDEAEKAVLNESIGQLVSDTPMTTVAAGRFKKLITKAGPAAAGMLREVLVTVMTDAAKRQIWG